MTDFEGKNRKQIVAHATHPFGITMFGPYLYWTDWYNKSVYRAPKAGGAAAVEVRHSLRGALDIRSVSKKRQPEDQNPCANKNGGCSHLCFFKGDSYSCGCPDVPDNISCKEGKNIFLCNRVNI